MGLIEKSEVIDLESEFVNGKRKFLKKIEILKNRKDSREKYCEYNIKYSSKRAKFELIQSKGIISLHFQHLSFEVFEKVTLPSK